MLRINFTDNLKYHLNLIITWATECLHKLQEIIPSFGLNIIQRYSILFRTNPSLSEPIRDSTRIRAIPKSVSWPFSATLKQYFNPTNSGHSGKVQTGLIQKHFLIRLNLCIPKNFRPTLSRPHTFENPQNIIIFWAPFTVFEIFFKLGGWVWNFCHCLHYRRIILYLNNANKFKFKEFEIFNWKKKIELNHLIWNH